MDEVVEGPERCRQLVQSINKALGFVSEEKWATYDRETKDAFHTKDGLISTAVSTLARNLYTSNARFVLELLQNCDDNQFSRAEMNGQRPYVTFKVHHDRVVVECNEDGFTEKNFQAICAVGKSSKTGVQHGYIGEKGIGFKSVFMAAWKVEIQAGDLSFYFKYRLGDEGLGMIRPIWLDPLEQLPRPLTRMTLWLHENGGEEQRSARSEAVRQQFEELDPNLLLFMKNLRELRVFYFDRQGAQESSTVFSIQNANTNLATVTKNFVKDGEQGKTESQVYYLVRHTVGNLEKNDNRVYSDDEEQTRAYATSTVVLGFPLDADSAPIDKHQKVFAFLPMKEEGFKFLIQGDFVTQANREDIVITSQRNVGIRTGIGDAFIKAVSEFCNHPTLAYNWVRFLPDKDGRYDAFWTRLIQTIEAGLQEMPALQPWSHRSLRTISDLRRSRPDTRDKNGEPLFGGKCLDINISGKYESANLERLCSYGLKDLTLDEFFDFVEEDLLQDISRIKSSETDEDWHTRVARMLTRPFEESNLNHFRGRVLRMKLLPLQDEQWVSAKDENVHFSESDGIRIPQRTGLTLLNPAAEKNSQRIVLFKHLGARTPTAELVRERILDPVGQSGMSLTIWADHLKFLYQTHHLVEDPTVGKTNLFVVDHKRYRRRLRFRDVYLPDRHPFGAQELFGKFKEGEEPEDALQLSFLHESYFSQPPEKPDSTCQSWHDWLCSYAGIRRYVCLVSTDQPQTLSKAVYFVVNNYPEKFFGFLRHHWSEGGREIRESVTLHGELSNVRVPCEGGHMIAIKETYLPFPDLQARRERFLRGQETFPFLLLDTTVERGTYAQDWSFLVPRFDIGLNADMDFYMRMLLQIRATEAKKIEDPERIIELYKTIYGKWAESPVTEMNKKTLRSFFIRNSLVFVPSTEKREAVWAKPNDCLWDAPAFFASRYPLSSCLEKLLCSEPSTKVVIQRLFVDILGTSYWNWLDIIEELKYIKRHLKEEIDEIYVLYERLQELMPDLSAENNGEIRETFEKDALIYVESNGVGAWHRISECLWSSATPIHGKVTLDDDYDDLELLFVKLLGVTTLDLQLVYDELIRLGHAPDATPDRVTEQIRALNGLLVDASSYPKVKPQPLRKARIFPVWAPGADVEPELSTQAQGFLIVDRAHLGRIFASQIRTLAFDLDQIHELADFFQWLGIEDHFYLSDRVKEITRVDEADKVPVPLSRCRIRPKAYALCCIAFHFKSPRLENTSLAELQEKLRSACVYETNGISSVLQLSVAGGPILVEPSSSSDLHLHETESQLEIFIPRKKKRRVFCFAEKLPAYLFQWLMTDPDSNQWGQSSDKGCRVVASVLNASQSVSYQILEENGIVIPAAEDLAPSEDEDQSESEDEDGSEVTERHRMGERGRAGAEDYEREPNTPREILRNLAAAPEAVRSDGSSTRACTPSPSLSHNTPSPLLEHREASYVTARARDAVSRSETRSRVSVSVEPPRAQEHTNEDTARYRQLLDRIISCAREAVFPTNPDDSMDMSALRAELPELPTDEAESSFDGIGEHIRFRSTHHLERDRMIGAAGELYVFELLKALSPELTDFSLANWQSTIRTYVRAHTQYADIERWPGSRETADIVYNDAYGILTKIFIDCDYLDGTLWNGARPTYYLEVKATTGPCEIPFFMSKAQYQRMRNYRGSRENVYVILRVYNVGKERIGLRVYVDPAEKEASGQLVFTGEVWTVTQGS